MGQEVAIRRLSVEKRCFLTQTSKLELVSDFGARAGRIAATYARFYLEQEEGCNPKLKGRFYWMGLAAFASKQVRCALDFMPSEEYFTLPVLTPARVPLRIAKNALGMGNFWLFQDIYVWHWFYAKYPSQFGSCTPERSVQSYEPSVKANVRSLPWAKEALPKVKELRTTAEIEKAFNLTKLTEGAGSLRERQQLQYDSLVVIANHEQINILQPLIYESTSFQLVLDAQVAMEDVPMAPKRVAAFSTACDNKQDELRVQMQEGDLYNQDDRMKFISKIAGRYHQLMSTQTTYMEGVLREIATWNNLT
jgi:hypothetical protein